MIGCRVALLASLAACANAGGASLSGSAEESAKSESGQASLWERTRSLLFERGKITEMAANGIIADAFIEDARSRGVDARRFTAYALLPVDGKRLALDQAVRDAIPSAKAERQLSGRSGPQKCFSNPAVHSSSDYAAQMAAIS